MAVSIGNLGDNRAEFSQVFPAKANCGNPKCRMIKKNFFFLAQNCRLFTSLCFGK
jgi:hypothetical protein